MPLLLACGNDRSGGTVRIQMPLPDVLDLGALESDLDDQLAVHIYSGLVTLNAAGDPIPDLAQRWSLSPDGRTYHFPLRPNLRFHDGERLTADHIKEAWQRLLDPQIESPAALHFLGKITGVSRFRNGLAAEISGVRAANERSLEVELSETDLSFPAKLTNPITFVSPPGSQGGASPPVGSGPFSVVDWVPGKVLTLIRNEDYYGFDPLVDRVEISGGVDADSLNRYAQDNLDVLYVGANDISLVLDRNNPLQRDLNTHDGLDMAYLAMNNRIPPFDDVGVRQAFAMAIDRAAIVEQVFSHTVEKASTLLLPSLARTGESSTADFDISKARKALADSRYGDVSNLPEMTFTVPGTRGPAPPQVEALINMLQQHLGARINIAREPWDSFVSKLDKRENPFQLFLFTWHADFPDPQAVLDPLFRSNSLSNYSGYVSQEVDALLLEARGERDRNRRLQTIAAIEERVSADAPVTPLWHSRSYVLIKPWLRDVHLSATARPWLSHVYRDN